MQQRFCSCGHPVMVDYMFQGPEASKVSTRFYAPEAQRRGRIGTCPVCRRRLDIDTLR